jgi:hypothetical protein
LYYGTGSFTIDLPAGAYQLDSYSEVDADSNANTNALASAYNGIALSNIVPIDPGQIYKVAVGNPLLNQALVGNGSTPTGSGGGSGSTAIDPQGFAPDFGSGIANPIGLSGMVVVPLTGLSTLAAGSPTLPADLIEDLASQSVINSANDLPPVSLSLVIDGDPALAGLAKRFRPGQSNTEDPTT